MAMTGSLTVRKCDPGAHYSDYGILVVRTDPNVAKHKGLSHFFLDMKSPGVEIKPIKQLTGGANFNEVYFTDARIPDSQRLGEVGQGWQAALTTLMNERAAIGGGGAGVVEMAYRIANEVMIDDKPAIADSAVRAKLANWYVQESGLRFTGYRSMTAMSRGEFQDQNSIGKLVVRKTQDGVILYGSAGMSGWMKIVEEAGQCNSRWVRRG